MAFGGFGGQTIGLMLANKLVANDRHLAHEFLRQRNFEAAWAKAAGVAQHNLRRLLSDILDIHNKIILDNMRSEPRIKEGARDFLQMVVRKEVLLATTNYDVVLGNLLPEEDTLYLHGKTEDVRPEEGYLLVAGQNKEQDIDTNPSLKATFSRLEDFLNSPLPKDLLLIGHSLKDGHIKKLFNEQWSCKSRLFVIDTAAPHEYFANLELEPILSEEVRYHREPDFFGLFGCGRTWVRGELDGRRYPPHAWQMLNDNILTPFCRG